MENQLHFYTTGEAFTELLEGYYRSGLFDLFDQLLGDNLNEDQKKLAFRLRIKLTGSTQNDGDLSCHFLEEDPEDFAEKLYFAVKTSIKDILNEDLLELEWISEREEGKNIKVLLKYISADEICYICRNQILKEKGYEITEFPSVEEDRTINGVITKDGSFIECGYQDHINLFPILYRAGLSDAGDWTDSREVIHISSSQLGGYVIHNFEDRFSREGYYITPEQVQTLWRLKKWVSETRSSFGDNNICSLIRKYVVDQENLGGKYGNLKFLERFYPDIKLPRFSTNLDDFRDHEKVFIRTSPKHSLPGLLNSRVINTSEENYAKAKEEIINEFDQFKDVKENNEIHWFIQELLEGGNGVCHIRKEPNCRDSKYTFRYQLSENQGDVVNGKITTHQLTYPQERELKRIALEIFNDLDQSIQLEFVVHEGDIYIVQLRILENEFDVALGSHRPSDILYEGLTFSKGSGTLSVEDILIVSEDALPEDLLNKKALIVENNSEFSHILALAKTLRIPAIYGTGPIDFGDNKKVNFNATCKEGFIYL